MCFCTLSNKNDYVIPYRFGVARFRAFFYAPKQKPEFDKDDLAAASKIFVTVIQERAFDKLNKEGVEAEDRKKVMQELGKDIRDMIQKYTGVDSHTFYN